MKERPILFSAPMVRALLDGSKTQTRRAFSARMVSTMGHAAAAGEVSYFIQEGAMQPNDSSYVLDFCPYGQPGDRLWVRETYQPDPECDGTWAYVQWAGCKGSPLSDIPKRFRKPEHCIYRADWTGTEIFWRPSIHMPRWASRILLEIVSVRVERLNDCSDEDATAEGCEKNENGYFWAGPHSVSGRKQMATARGAYKDLWESINGDGAWAANPWCWAITFRRIQS